MSDPKQAPKRIPSILPIALALAASAVPDDFEGDVMDYLLSDAFPELSPKETDQESDD